MRTPLSPSRSIRRSQFRWVAALGFFLFVAAASSCMPASPAQAHGFGQRYDLPLPLSFYIAGACVAIVVTFLIVGLFVRDVPRSEAYPRLDLSKSRLGHLIASPGLAFALGLCGLAIFIITVIAGFRGQQDPYRNLAPTLACVLCGAVLA